MRQSDTIGALAKALASAQKEIKAAPQNANNPFFKSKYADLGSIIESAREPLTKNGLAVSQSPFTRDGAIGVETILMHESGEWIANDISIPLGEVKGKTLAQEAGSIITYLRRYAYAATVGAYADEDTDGNSNGNKQQQAPAPRVAAVTMNVPPAIHMPSKATRESFFALANAHGMGVEGARIASTHKGDWSAAMTELQALIPA